MAHKLNAILIRTGFCFGFATLFALIGCSNTSAYTRVPPPGTWGSASNSYYSLPGNSWTPAAPGAIGSGVPAAPPTGAIQPTAANPSSNKTTSIDNGLPSTANTASFTSSSGASGVQTASGIGDSNPVRIAVFSDQDADGSQVVPAGSTAPPSTTTVPASQLPWRNP